MPVPHERTPVTDEGEVWIDGYPYSIKNITVELANIFSRKVNQGDPTFDDHPIFSTSAQKSWMGGWLVLDQNPASDLERFYKSTCQTDIAESLTIPTQETELSAPDGEDGTPVMVGAFSHGFYVNWGNRLYRYMPGNLQAPSLVGDMGSSAMGPGRTYITQDSAGPGDPYFFIPVNGGYVTLDNSGTLSAGTASQTVVDFEVWDQKIWRLDADGSLKWMNDLPALEDEWEFSTQIPDGGTPRGLLSFIRMDGEPCLIVITDGQVWKHDFGNNTLHAEDLWFPRHPLHGLAAVRHQTALRVSAGTGIYRYDNNTISVDDGLDSRNGLPPEYRGHIVSMSSGLNEFYALIQGLGASDGDVTEDHVLSLGNPDPLALSPVNARNLLLRNNSFGWHYVWDGSVGTPTNVLTSNLLGYYSLWWGAGGKCYTVQLPETYYNPDEERSVKLPSKVSCRHYTSWVDWGWAGQPKILKMVEIEAGSLQHEGNEVRVYYRIDDYDAPEVLLGEVTSNGEHRWFLGQDQAEPTLRSGRGTYAGIPHERFQLIFELIRPAEPTGTNLTPWLNPPTLRRHLVMARKWLRPQRTFRCQLDLTKDVKDHKTDNMLRHLLAAAETQQAVVFQHQDYELMVDLSAINYTDSTGREKGSSVMVTLVESIEHSLELESIQP
jgi:hypothetical protein